MSSRSRVFFAVLAVVADGALIACSEAPTVTSIGCKGAACEDDTNSPSGASGAKPCEDEAIAYCANFERCVPAQFQFSVYPSRDACVARRKIACEVKLAAPGTSATATRIAECARDRKTFSCEDVFAAGAPAACAPLAGTLDDGKACLDSAQCKNRLCIFPAYDKTCGVCTKLPAIGEDCNASQGACPDFSICAAGKCAALGKAGDACGDTQPCRQDLACIDGHCAAPVAEHAPCKVGTSSCALTADNYCDTTTNVCTKGSAAGVGDPCSPPGATDRVRCTWGSVCAVPTGTDVKTRGTCVAPAADGRPCGGTTGLQCSYPARCVSNVCTLPSASACN